MRAYSLRRGAGPVAALMCAARRVWCGYVTFGGCDLGGGGQVYRYAHHCLFLGRGYNYPVALEVQTYARGARAHARAGARARSEATGARRAAAERRGCAAAGSPPAPRGKPIPCGGGGWCASGELRCWRRELRTGSAGGGRGPAVAGCASARAAGSLCLWCAHVCAYVSACARARERIRTRAGSRPPASASPPARSSAVPTRNGRVPSKQHTTACFEPPPPTTTLRRYWKRWWWWWRRGDGVVTEAAAAGGAQDEGDLLHPRRGGRRRARTAQPRADARFPVYAYPHSTAGPAREGEGVQVAGV